MLALESIGRIRAIHWVAASGAILLIDYATGPFIQFPILFVVPVALASITHGVRGGAAVAVLLPLARLSFFLQWTLPASWILEVVDTAVDIVILVGFAVLVDQLVRQQREIRVLRGFLPICGFCKRIRDEDGHWQAMESFIGQRSEARFTHTFCPECGRKHYSNLIG